MEKSKFNINLSGAEITSSKNSLHSKLREIAKSQKNIPDYFIIKSKYFYSLFN